MTGFEPGFSGFGSDRAANCATTIAQLVYMFMLAFKLMFLMRSLGKG